MRLGLFTAYYDAKPLEEVCAFAASSGYQAVELACWYRSKHVDADRVVTDREYASAIRGTVERHGLEISCLSNHLDGQLVLGPLDRTTDSWAPTPDPDDKVRFGVERMRLAAQAANVLEVDCVTSFIGSAVWGQWYNHGSAMIEMYEEAWETFADRWNPILDSFKEYGVRFACEVHPVQMAFNIETSARAVEALNGRPEFGFNFDPSHFVWQSIDPAVFVYEFADRIYHVHAKDTELVKRNIARSGVLAGGPWERLDRGVRFRCPGWGEIDWHNLMTALAEIGYDGVISYEHEDPILTPEDAARKCATFLGPLLIDRSELR